MTDLSEHVIRYRKAALRSFLMQRRGRLCPHDFGLVSHGRRRTSGLNRNEVAQLAGLTAYWYERFETQRNAKPGIATLEAVSKALLLNADERAYLRLLSLNQEPDYDAPSGDLLATIAEAGELTAFAVFDAGYQRARSNALHDWLFGYPANGHALENNALYRLLYIDATRVLWGDAWSAFTARQIGTMRWLCALTGTVPSVVHDLQKHELFAKYWDDYEVAIPKTICDVDIEHPEAGLLKLRIYAPRVQPDSFFALYVPRDTATANLVRQHVKAQALPEEMHVA